MLSKVQEKLIKQLHTKKGRAKHGLCLVEGSKSLATAGDAVEFTFGERDSTSFKDLVTTETPQDVAGVARVPEWGHDDIASAQTVVVLDGVQDPGNVGAIFRLCLGFGASLVLIESADPTNPKVVRSSAGALFDVPYVEYTKKEGLDYVSTLERPVYRLEKTDSSQDVVSLPQDTEIILIAGSEGNGITLPIKGASVSITHSKALESLNVTHALAIALHALQR